MINRAGYGEQPDSPIPTIGRWAGDAAHRLGIVAFGSTKADPMVLLLRAPNRLTGQAHA